jgi:hypothetical protein
MMTFNGVRNSCDMLADELGLQAVGLAQAVQELLGLALLLPPFGDVACDALVHRAARRPG